LTRRSGTRQYPERPGDKLIGAVAVDKPQGWTSHDVVNKVRRLAGTRKVGHLGTLDPNATGVLPLLLGRATRLAQYFGDNEKVYEALICFGHSTDTYDVAGTATSPHVEFSPERETVVAALERFQGSLDQMPPPVSAKKVGGIPAYKLARANQPVELKPVRIEVHSIELLTLAGPEATVRIRCSAGTYVRSIAHELGIEFGCGAYLKALRRTASGEFAIGFCRTIEELAELADQGRFEEAIIPGSRLLAEVPAETCDDVTVGQIRHGREFRISPFRGVGEPPLVKALSTRGELVAVGQILMPNVYRPVLVL